ncbi:MAG TPA: chemotaxis protein CheD [Anaeromyxobacter sp.]
MSTLAENFARLTALPPPTSAVYVHPGRLAASGTAASFTTVVGSGAAVCIYDPVRGVGGMAHFLLPDRGNAPSATRYGDVALTSLLEELGKLGGHSYRATVHGGSAPPIVSETEHLGDRNVAAALSFLSSHGIPVLERDVGGKGARKIVFDLAGGAVQVTRVGA